MFHPLKTPDLMCHLVVSVSKICEENPSLLDEFTMLEKSEAIETLSLLANISQIYVECSIHPAVVQPIQLDLLLVFWLFLTKDKRTVQYCVQTPQVWTFLAIRLHASVFNTNASQLKGEIWFLLEILSNMAAFLRESPHSPHCLEFGPWLDIIAKASANAAWRKSKHHVFIRSALMLSARLSSISPKFGRSFADKVTFQRLVRLAVSPCSDVESPAIHCLAKLMPELRGARVNQEISSSPHFSSFLLKMVN